ncbi:MAG TPA: hypothetical protein VFR76_14865, partial [Verrucomicrobiae bacterium]|nr:hypothetical protein [Verrucomicrobiae bacterium]
KPLNRADKFVLYMQHKLVRENSTSFMESPDGFDAVHWDHELRGGCIAGVLACAFTRCLARCLCWRRDAVATRSRDGRATRFMESVH